MEFVSDNDIETDKNESSIHVCVLLGASVSNACDMNESDLLV